MLPVAVVPPGAVQVLRGGRVGTAGAGARCGAEGGAVAGHGRAGKVPYSIARAGGDPGPGGSRPGPGGGAGATGRNRRRGPGAVT
ncbi:hypothetical protein KFL01_20060 [Kocuria flava]|uniref:PE-PGRS family protein n=1 Tax=Kocuria flava TaxID=446860 RepID=A0ABQ0X5U7_9MICC|nr:hypothetical protein KFL01_20060 [Kocuria flava]